MDLSFCNTPIKAEFKLKKCGALILAGISGSILYRTKNSPLNRFKNHHLNLGAWQLGPRRFLVDAFHGLSGPSSLLPLLLTEKTYGWKVTNR